MFLLLDETCPFLIVFQLPIPNRRVNGILRQHAAVELHRRQLEMTGNVGIFYSQHLVDCLPLDPLGCNAAAEFGSC